MCILPFFHNNLEEYDDEISIIPFELKKSVLPY